VPPYEPYLYAYVPGTYNIPANEQTFWERVQEGTTPNSPSPGDTTY
jgi:hypothetical protein